MIPTPPSSLDLTEAPPWLADRYDRIALVSHRRHLGGLEPDESATLVVATDWLLWQICLEQHRHALHFEHLLAEPGTEPGAVPGMVLRAGAWIHDGETDLTRFAGVSLGQAHVRQSVLAVQAFERLWRGLDRLCRRFRPGRVVLFDLRGDFDLIDDGSKRQLVALLARQHGLAVEDRFDPVPPGDPDFPNPPVFVPRKGDWRKDLLRRLYARMVAGAFHLGWLWRGRPPKVLALLDVHQLTGMIRDCPGRPRIAPVIDAGAAPKSWAFLRQAWRAGLVLAVFPEAELGRGDQSRLAEIRRNLARRWSAIAGDSPLDFALQGAAAGFVAAGTLEDNARLVRRFEAALARHRFARVLVADGDFAPGRVVSELAWQRGIPVDESFNGIFLTDWRTPSRCGDGLRPPTLARALVWGEWCRSWLAAIGSPVEAVVTGYPSLDALSPLPPRSGPGRHALVLPIYTVELDPAALGGRVGQHLIETMRLLRRRGFDRIRVKVHPGHANPGWYRAVLDRFGFADVEVHGAGSVRAHAEWADIVIGPPTTGAMAECLALGRPYLACVAQPSALSLHHVPFLRVFTSTAELDSALERGWRPDITAILAQLCGPPGAAARVWRALEEGVSPAPPRRKGPETVTG